MTIRNALHRVNRGIVLAVVLLLGLTGYLIYDNVRFASEKVAIGDMVTEFAKAAGDLNILPAGERIPGEQPSEAAVKKKLQESEVVLNKYLSDWIDYGSAREIATRSIKEIFLTNADRRAYVTDCVYNIKSVKKIKKNGPSHAIADINVNVELKTIGKPMYFSLGGSQDTMNDGYYGGKPMQNEEDKDKIDTKTYTYTWGFTLYDAQLVKVGGQWRIARLSGWGYSNSGKLVED